MTQLSILPVFMLSPQVIWDLYMESKLHLFHFLETDMISLPSLFCCSCGGHGAAKVQKK